MDYNRIYNNIISRAQMKGRKKSRGRFNTGQYFEAHHIIPDFMFINTKRCKTPGVIPGDPDAKENIVLLTAKEHYICHILLYKIHQYGPYKNQYGSALYIFFLDRSKNREHIWNSKKYEKYRLIGLKSLSEKMKGKMPVKDIITGELIGRVRLDHQNVLSGQWVHHSKGTKQSKEHRAKTSKSTAGNKNPNFKEMTVDRKVRLFNLVPKCIVKNIFYKKLLDKALKEEFTEFNKISYQWVINNFGSMANFISEANTFLGTDYIYNKHNKPINRL